VIEGLIKNAEIAAKENINSGFPLFASSATLHHKLVSVLSEATYMPLDVFEKGEVVREERHCVPAYWFQCNGTISFNYEVGNERVETYTVSRGNSVETRERTRTDWSPSSSSANVSPALFAPGNRKHALRIKNLYTYLDHNKLIDIEELDFPHDVETHNYDLPQPAAYTEYIAPLVETMLEEKARGSVVKLNYKNFTLGGSTIQKEVVRVFLGLYHVVFKYGDKEYSVWITGDGERAFYEGMPEDAQRKKTLEEKNQLMEQEVSSIPVPKTVVFTLGIVMSIILGVVLARVVQFIVGLVAGLAGYIVFAVLRSRKRKAYDAQVSEVRAKFQKEIDDFNAQASNAVQQFKMQKKTLRGIYEEVAGSANAF
jgi:hypothetical protein